jgi:hypothetical protein
MDQSFLARASRVLFLVAAVTIASCTPAGTEKSSGDTRADSVRADSVARARQDSIVRSQPGYIVDSILPVEEELRRFRATIGGAPVTALAHGSASREELVRRIVRDVGAQDTADLRALSITAREFADIVYPSSPYTHPPYRQAPGLVWMQIATPSASGFGRLMQRRGGVAFSYAGHSCKPQPERQGDNLLWLDCTVRVVENGRDTTTQRWFGTIVERAGMFKLVSFANQF